jgi:hypothetical protein
MGGVDHHGWLAGKYAIGVRGKKWYWALFTRMIDMTLVWLLYTHTHGTDSLDLLSFKRAVTVPYLNLDTSRKQPGRPLSSPSSYLRVIPDVRFDGVGHVVARRKEQRRCARAGCKGKPRPYSTKCKTTLCSHCFAPHRNN